MKEIAKKDWEYTLVQDNDGAYVLAVVCGTIAVYTLEIRLNASETAEYLKKGIKYLEGLVNQVRSSPASFQDRAIRQ